MNTISILIQTLNEEQNIRHAMDSCSWAAEIFVVDNYSTDDTPQIVSAFPNARLIQRQFDGYAAQKNWALSHLSFRGDWILILDADEMVSTELQIEMISLANGSAHADGYYVNRKIIFLGKWLRFGGWYPSWNLRFFRKGRALYEERSVHEHMIVDGSCGYLSGHLIHNDRKDFFRWISKHNTFSTLEAIEAYNILTNPKQTTLINSTQSSPVTHKRILKERILYRLPFRPLLWFVYLYFYKLGFLDGKVGLIYSFLYAMQQLHTDIKILEYKHRLLKQSVQEYWDTSPCGVKYCPFPVGSKDFFHYTEERRNNMEYFIPQFAQFEKWKGKHILEVGCGIGIDANRFAVCGAHVTAIDASPTSVALTQNRIDSSQTTANVLVADAENLPFENASFDFVYSWGVLHHTPNTQKAINEVYRVLKPGGEFTIMLYHKYSLLGLQLYMRYALLRCKPFRSLEYLFANHLESPATNAYSKKEAREMFSQFSDVTVTSVVTPFDARIGRGLFLPRFTHRFIPSRLGFFLVIQGRKQPSIL